MGAASGADEKATARPGTDEAESGPTDRISDDRETGAANPASDTWETATLIPPVPLPHRVTK